MAIVFIFCWMKTRVHARDADSAEDEDHQTDQAQVVLDLGQ
jgi:hypothetical protein